MQKGECICADPTDRPMSAIHVAKNGLYYLLQQSRHWALTPSTFVRWALYHACSLVVNIPSTGDGP